MPTLHNQAILIGLLHRVFVHRQTFVIAKKFVSEIWVDWGFGFMRLSSLEKPTIRLPLCVYFCGNG